MWDVGVRMLDVGVRIVGKGFYAANESKSTVVGARQSNYADIRFEI